MEFNRLVSLVLGFIVLILLFVWISNRFRANTRTADARRVTVTVTPTVSPTITPTKKPGTGWNPFGFLSRNTPTPTKAAGKVTPTGIKVTIVKKETVQNTANGTQTGQTGQNGQLAQQESQTVVYKNYKTGKTIVVNEIPETGAPTIFMTLALAGLTGGIYLRRKI